jgi:alcohol dehydrogenase (cytochrome c)
MSFRVIAVTTVLLIAAALSVAIYSVDSLRWRADVLLRFAQGEITNVGLGELLRMLRPGSGFWIRPVVEGQGFVAIVKSPFDSKEGVAAGAKIFRQNCSICHGTDAGGVTAPSLRRRTELRHGSSDLALYRNIVDGIRGTPMAAARLSFNEAWQVVSFLKSLDPVRTAASAPESTDSDKSRLLTTFRRITAQDLLDAGRESGDWRMYSRTYDGWRFSPLTQVNTGNVAKLRLRWIRQLTGPGEDIETAPLVVNGAMLVTQPPADVLALDAASGEVLWHYHRQIDEQLALCCGKVNRGVAVLGEMVYVGTTDAHLIALDIKNGRVIWDVELGSPSEGYSVTGAPLTVRDMVITGVAGGEFGIRGFLQAVDAKTGKTRWRFYTIPAPGEPGGETWSGDAWRTGGGPTWITGGFDPKLNLIYWGVGNPSPEFNGDARPGDNLYTDSVVALDATTGRLVWHFQFTPHDEHDWDSNQVPVLTSIELKGTAVPVIAWANRNGFYYLLDRRDGRFLTGVAFVQQNWAEGLDQSGRPIPTSGAEVSSVGTLTYPSASGGTNWHSPAFNPRLRLLFVHAFEGASIFTKRDSREVKRRAFEFFAGSGSQLQGRITTFVRALNVASGKRVWQYQSSTGSGYGVSGLLATDGGLVFGAAGERVFALDASNGEELWSVNAGGGISQGPIAYQDGGDEVVVFVAGGAVIAFSL